LKEEALDRTMWRNRFGRGFGPVVWDYWWWWSTLFTARFELNLSVELRLIFIFKSQVSPCEIFGGQRGTQTGFSPIPPILHTHLYTHVAFTWTTKWRSQGTFQRAALFWK